MDERQFFPKNERLFLQNDINRLFNSGQSFLTYPLRIVYFSNNCNISSESGISVLISVPKKNIRTAVKRNRIKRLIRESIRLNKYEPSILYKTKKKQVYVAFIYICKDIELDNEITNAVKKAFETLNDRML